MMENLGSITKTTKSARFFEIFDTFSHFEPPYLGVACIVPSDLGVVLRLVNPSTYVPDLGPIGHVVPEIHQ